MHKLITVLLLVACSSSSSVVGDGGPGGVRDPNAVGPMGSDAGGDVTAATMMFPTCASLGYAGVPAVEYQGPMTTTWSCMGYGIGDRACELCGIGLMRQVPPPAACTVPIDRARDKDEPRGCTGWLCVSRCDECPRTSPRNCEAAP